MDHMVGTREEWRKARLDLLEAEKELTRRGDELARRRRELPWVPVEEDYRFDAPDGEVALADLFGGRSQLLVYHFMFGPDWDAGCPTCSSLADGFDGIRVHLEHHDVALVAISRAPVDKLIAYRQRMGPQLPLGVIGQQQLQLRPRRVVHPGEPGRRGGVQLPGDPGRPDRPGGAAHRRARAERLRTRGRHRLPYLFRLRPRLRRDLGHVVMARPGAARP